MLLIKDPKTKQPSWTITGVILTFLIALVVLVLFALKIIENETILWAGLGLHIIYLAVYRNKRIRASLTSGIDFGADNE